MTTLASASEIPRGVTACDGSPFGPLPETPLEPGDMPSGAFDVPVLYGHYWRTGPHPTIESPKTACLDWSIAKGGQLVAYRWSGEQHLTNNNLVAWKPA